VFFFEVVSGAVVGANTAARRWMRFDERADRSATPALTSLLAEDSCHLVENSTGPRSAEQARAEAQTLMLHSRHGETLEFQFHRDATSAGRRWVAIAAATHSSSAGPAEATGAQVDEERLSAYRDEVTGLANRRALWKRFSPIATTPDEVKLPADCAVIFIDLDNFKTVNDEQGHATGDELLRQIAEQLADCLRPGDFVGRYGGDEFLVVIDQMPLLEPVKTICERIGEAIAKPVTSAGRTWRMTASQGVAHSGAAGRSLAETMAASDQAMYRAKALGGGGVAWENKLAENRSPDRKE
jgi:diguanylate cyclase (GGDEF)-like protein